MVKFNSDVDIDVADRAEILQHVAHVKASQFNVEGALVKHNSGIYGTRIPYDGLIEAAAIDHRTAEARGYLKVDLLNMSVYSSIRDQAHYEALLAAPVPWPRLYERDFCEQVIHISNWYSTLLEMPGPVNSIPRLAMFLSVIRPGKKHLIGRPWDEVAATIWDRNAEDGYIFKKAHAVALAMLATLHMKILNEATA